jgi:hypothetical protein
MLSQIFDSKEYSPLTDNLKEDASLADNLKEDSSLRPDQAEILRRNFFVMCIVFSLNHGAAVSCIAYAAAELGSDLGSSSSGILYICYALSAWLISKPFVCYVGPKLALLASLSGT